MIRIAMPVLVFMASVSALMVLMIVVVVVMQGSNVVRFVTMSTCGRCIRGENLVLSMGMSDVPTGM